MNFRQISVCLLLFLIICSCSDPTKEPATEISIVSQEAPPGQPMFNNGNLELKTFEVKDSLNNKVLGWGYDIYVDGKRAIHQPIIPAIPGNNSFSSEEKAKSTGMFAIDKMKRTGSLPTITKAELDSLGTI